MANRRILFTDYSGALHLLAASLVLSATSIGCAKVGRIANDPSRLCPPGQRLVVHDGAPRCIARCESSEVYNFDHNVCEPLQPEGMPRCDSRANSWSQCAPGLPGVPCWWAGNGRGPAFIVTTCDNSTPSPAPDPTVAPPTAGPTPTPTQAAPQPGTPTPAPTALPTSVPATSCMNLDEPPATAVPIFTGQPCRSGFVAVNAKDGARGCIRQWACEIPNERCNPGDDCFSPFRRIQASLDNGSVYRCKDGEAPGPQFICDGDRPGQEAYGRNVRPDGSVIVPEGVDHDQPWKRASICGPRPCPPPPPVATPPGGATPLPSVPTGGVRGFSLGWTNISDHCRAFKDLGGGTCRCTSDGAHRYKGTLVPQEKFVQNTVDRDHWFLVVEPTAKPADKTDAEWAETLQAHRDTYQLGQGDEWIVAQGITVEGSNVHSISKLDENPYQSDIIASCGAQIEVRGCMDANAYSCPDRFRGEEKGDGTLDEDGNPARYSEFDCRPEHRRPVPGAGGCGPWKAYEVKP